MRRASPLAALAACLLLATSCQQPEPEAAPATLAPVPPTPTRTPAPTPTPTPPPDPYAVPTPIDPAYAERVINRLYEINGDAARLSFEAGVVTPEARLLLESIYEPPVLNPTAEVLELEVAAQRPQVRRPPGNVVMVVEEVLATSPSCFTAVGLRDLTGTLVEPPDRSGQLDLVKMSRGEPSAPNDTGWRIALMETRVDGTRSDLCAPS